jgi:predicted amidohydrolase YtcJ
MKNITFLLLLLTISSCKLKEEVDFIVINSHVYTVNDHFDRVEAFAVKDGKIFDVGTNVEIQSKYRSTFINDTKGKTVVPGLIDAHCHFYGLGLEQQKVDLSGTKSFEEVIDRIVNFQKKYNLPYITGRGWDQNDWKIKEYPTKEKLDKLFPNTPIAVRRIDGHALLANQAAIDLANVTISTTYTGGEILQKDGKLTGVFIDNPMELIKRTIPKPTRQMQINALKVSQKINFAYGLTTVDDAGLSQSTIELIDSLHQTGDLKIKIYAMVSATDKSIDYYTKKGIIKTNRLHVRSFKVYADGALGSRGATLKKSYNDKHNHYGALVTPISKLKEYAVRIAKTPYQMNTHAIGDSANYVMLKTYTEVLQGKKDRRWRIEHAQVIDTPDFDFFKNIFPSVQPTHATSDMYWAADRLGDKRVKNAYAYKKLLNTYGKVALGTDYPVEKVNPMLTFFAAVARQDLMNYPKEGFQIENALTREEALKGMTIWAAYANFEEEEKGSIEIGKTADFTILDKDLMLIDINKIPGIRIEETYVNGEKVN